VIFLFEKPTFIHISTFKSSTSHTMSSYQQDVVHPSHYSTGAEQVPPGASQVYPAPYQKSPALPPTSVEDSSIEPTISLIAASIRWERYLEYEKRLNRELSSCILSLQDRLQQLDASLKVLTDDNDRLRQSLNTAQQYAWSPLAVSFPRSTQILG